MRLNEQNIMDLNRVISHHAGHRELQNICIEGSSFRWNDNTGRRIWGDSSGGWNLTHEIYKGKNDKDTMSHLTRFQASILTKVRISKLPQQICHSSESWNLPILNLMTLDEGRDLPINTKHCHSGGGRNLRIKKDVCTG